MVASSNITERRVRMRTRMVQLEGVMLRSSVDAIDHDLSSIRHGGARVTVTLKGVVPVDACTCPFYA